MEYNTLMKIVGPNCELENVTNADIYAIAASWGDCTELEIETAKRELSEWKLNQ